MALLRHRRPFSIRHFAHAVHTHQPVGEFPLLTRFLALAPLLRGLLHLPTALSFVDRTISRHTRRMALAEARAFRAVDPGGSGGDSGSGAASGGGTGIAALMHVWDSCWRLGSQLSIKAPRNVKGGVGDVNDNGGNVGNDGDNNNNNGNGNDDDDNEYHEIAVALPAAMVKETALPTMIGCMEIPTEYYSLRLEPTSPLSLLAPSARDEGVCVAHVLQHLASLHNGIVSMAGGESAGLGGRGIGGEGGWPAFVEWIRDRAVEVGAGGEVRYNFEAAERHVAVLCRRAPIAAEQPRLIAYTDDESLSLGALHAKVPQAPLPPDLLSDVISEAVHAGRVRDLLTELDTCAAFLLATGGSGRALATTERRVKDYVEQVLLMDSALGRAGGEGVELRHVAALREALAETVNPDPFVNVASKYKRAMGEEVAAEVAVRAGGMDVKLLLPTLRALITSQLVEEYLNAETPIKEVLAYAEVGEQGETLGELDWFEEMFDDTWPLSEAVSLFGVLSGC
jgi:hypothetical protein